MTRAPLAVILTAIAASACGQSSPPTAAHTAPPAAKVENAKPEGDLATVKLTPEAEAHLALKIDTVGAQPVVQTRTVGGEAVLPPGRSVIVNAPVAGTLALASGRAVAAGQVARGDTIFELLPIQTSDRDVQIGAEKDVKEADARLAEANQRVQRLEQLLKDGSTSARSVEEARANQAVAAAAADAARQRLTSASRLPVGPRGEMALKAPFDGVITALHAAAGQSIAAGAPVFEVAQVSNLWVRVAVFAGELEAIDTAQPAAISSLGRELTGPWTEARRVAGPPAANAMAASVDLFFELPRGAGAFRPGERLAVRLPQKSATTGTAIVIPPSAIVYDLTGGTWVYEAKAPHVFARKRVELAGPSGAFVVVRRGLTEGTRIVTVGAAELYGTEFYVSK
jgi:RND family efflux transporter MFP subunit